MDQEGINGLDRKLTQCPWPASEGAVEKRLVSVIGVAASHFEQRSKQARQEGPLVNIITLDTSSMVGRWTQCRHTMDKSGDRQICTASQ
jgi:hypothetical protein